MLPSEVHNYIDKIIIAFRTVLLSKHTLDFERVETLQQTGDELGQDRIKQGFGFTSIHL